MKKALSIFLAIVMLLGLLAMGVSATEDSISISYNLTLKSDITMTFYLFGVEEGAAPEISITKGGNTNAYTATYDAKYGAYAVFVPGLTPLDMATEITATYDTVSCTASIKGACEYYLSQATYSDELWTLVVDLLNYGAATEKYINGSAAANADLTELQKKLGSGEATISGEGYTLPDADPDNDFVTWVGATLLLQDSVAYKYYFSVGDKDLNLISFEIGGATYEGSSAKFDDEKNCYYIVHNKLDPTMILTDVTAVAKVNGNPVSREFTFSAMRYAKGQVDADASADLLALLKAIVNYANATEAYKTVGDTYTAPETGRDIAATGALDSFETYRLSVLDTSAFSGWGQLGGFTSDVYGAIGVDLSTYINLNINNFKNTILYSGGVRDESVDGYDATNVAMLVDGLWGGTAVGGTSDQAEAVLNADDFEIGDILTFRYRGSSSHVWHYYINIYLGDGKFLTNNNLANIVEAGSEKIYDNELNADGSLKFDTVDILTCADLLTIYPDKWEYFFVLRPNQLDANYAPGGETGGETGLTEQQKQTLANLNPTDFSRGNLNAFPVAVYNAIGIDLSAYLTDTVKDMAGTIINTSGPIADADNDYARMMVDGLWGGTFFAGTANENYKPGVNDFEAGDIICIRHMAAGASKWSFTVAVYQGNGNFLTVGPLVSSAVASHDYDTFLTINAGDWNYFFVLRPTQLSEDDTTGGETGGETDDETGLTQNQKDALAAIDPTTLSRGNLNAFPAAVYNKIGIDISSYFTLQVNNFKSTILYSGGVKDENVSGYNATNVAMLVDGLWGGAEGAFGECEQIVNLSGLDTSKLKAGDILAGRYSANNTSSPWTQVVAVYQGNGNFLIVAPGESGVVIYTFDQICALNSGAWQYFFVLRPTNVLNAN